MMGRLVIGSFGQRISIIGITDVEHRSSDGRHYFSAMLIRALATVALMFPFALGAHDFHVSLTEVRHNPKEQTLEVSVRLFTDDLDKAIVLSTGQSTGLFAGSETPATEGLISAYLSRNIGIEVDGKPLKLQFLGKELQTDAVWCYLEVKEVRNASRIKVRNASLLEVFPDQTNMVNVHVGSQTRSVLLRKGSPEGTLGFSR